MKRVNKFDIERRRYTAYNEIRIDEWFLYHYQNSLLKEEISLIERLEEIESLIEKQMNTVQRLRKCIFAKMYKKRKENENANICNKS